MRVLQIASSLRDWGGIERYVAYLTDGLSQRGHEVRVTCPKGSPLEKALPNGAGIEIGLRRKIDFAALSAYLKLFRRERFDVVHSHFSPDFTMPALAARLRRQPLAIMTRHVAQPWARPKARLYMALFDHVIPVSNAVERVLERSGVPAARMTVAKAGTPPLEPKMDRGQARAALGEDPGTFAIGSFSRFVPEKGLESVFEAANLLNEEVRFHLFGNGPLEDQFRRRAEETSGRVRVHGYIESVADVMSAMDAVIVPSVWEEAFPYAVLEAMSLGKPVLASRVGGMTEVVEHGVTGLLFPKNDPQAIASSIESLRTQPELLKQMGQTALQRHTATYTIESMSERIDAVYEKAVGLS